MIFIIEIPILLIVFLGGGILGQEVSETLAVFFFLMFVFSIILGIASLIKACDSIDFFDGFPWGASFVLCIVGVIYNFSHFISVQGHSIKGYEMINYFF